MSSDKDPLSDIDLESFEQRGEIVGDEASLPRSLGASSPLHQLCILTEVKGNPLWHIPAFVADEGEKGDLVGGLLWSLLSECLLNSLLDGR